jgi:hypothetical protein
VRDGRLRLQSAPSAAVPEVQVDLEVLCGTPFPHREVTGVKYSTAPLRTASIMRPVTG